MNVVSDVDGKRREEESQMARVRVKEAGGGWW